MNASRIPNTKHRISHPHNYNAKTVVLRYHENNLLIHRNFSSHLCKLSNLFPYSLECNLCKVCFSVDLIGLVDKNPEDFTHLLRISQ